MNPKLEQKLYNKYPNIFKNKDTSLFLGITCDDGWYPLVNLLCSKIDSYAKHKNIDVQVAQVKEKFGGLRFYVDMSEWDEHISGMISFAESMSYKICERCSKPGTIRKGGWVKTYCGSCYKKNNLAGLV